MLLDSLSVSPSVSARSPAASHPPAPEAELEFGEVLAGLLRQRYILLGFVLLGLLGGLLAAVTAKKTYSAAATVEFTQPSTRALGLDDPSSAGELSSLELLNTELKTQVSEITDDDTTLAVIEQLQLDKQKPYAIPANLGNRDLLGRERGLPLERAPHQRERVIKLFQAHLNVDVVKGTRLLNIAFTDGDPVRAAEVANAVVAASISQTSGRRHSAFSQVSTWLTDQLASLKQRVEDSQGRAEDYASANEKDLAGMTVSATGPTGRNGQAQPTTASESVPVSRLLTLNNELTNAQVARIAKEAIFRVAQTGDPEAVLSIANSSLVTGQGADSSLAPGNGGLALLQRLREQDVQANVQMATAATKYGVKNQVMVEYHHQQAAIQSQMQAELQRIRDRAHSDLELATRAEDGLRQQVTAQQGEVSQWTTKADHLLLLQGEAASSRELYQDLYAKLQESQFAAGIQASRVAVLDPARAPTSPSSPKRLTDLTLGLLVGLVLGFIAALALELLDDSLHSEEQLRKALGTPVLGSIPRFQGAAREAEAWVIRDPRSRIAEAYRSFRTAIFGDRTTAPCRVLLVASARPAEGKATTCLNTAAALAVQGLRVLVVNADLRRRSATDAFGFPTSRGLSECLTEGAEAEALVQPFNAIENLFFLPAGSPPENPSELLSSSRFCDLLDELRLRYDHILIDSPPALLFTDTKILLGCVDAYVLVAKASRTPKRDLQKALEELYGSGAAFLGVLFNGSKVKAPKYTKFGYGA